MISILFLIWGSLCVNYRNPGPRRGEPRVGSGPDVAFPVDPLDPLDPVDPVQNSVRLIFIVKNNVFLQFCGKWSPIFGGLSSEAPSWRQDGRRCDLERLWTSMWRPLGADIGAKMAQVAPRWAKLGLSWRSNLASVAPREELSLYIYIYIYIYIYKLPIHCIHAAG